MIDTLVFLENIDAGLFYNRYINSRIVFFDLEAVITKLAAKVSLCLP